MLVAAVRSAVSYWQPAESWRTAYSSLGGAAAGRYA